MSKPAQSPEPITLSVNAIVGGRFYHAGNALPYEREEDLPESLKAFVAAAEPAPEPSGPARADYEYGVVYNIDAEGSIITRAGARQARALAAQAAQRDYMEAQAGT